jgi:hypothetical protein
LGSGGTLVARTGRMDSLEKPQVKTFLDRISSSLEGVQAEVEIAGLDVGDQVEQHWTALTGVSYDVKSDTITISTASHTHNIRRPLDVYARWNAGPVEQLIFSDPDGRRYFVKFRRPLVLPAGVKARPAS